MIKYIIVEIINAIVVKCPECASTAEVGMALMFIGVFMYQIEYNNELVRANRQTHH